MNGNCCFFEPHTHTHALSKARSRHQSNISKPEPGALPSSPPPGRKPSEEHWISLTFRAKPSTVSGQGHSAAAGCQAVRPGPREETGRVKARLAAGVFPREAPHPGAASPAAAGSGGGSAPRGRAAPGLPPPLTGTARSPRPAAPARAHPTRGSRTRIGRGGAASRGCTRRRRRPGGRAGSPRSARCRVAAARPAPAAPAASAAPWPTWCRSGGGRGARTGRGEAKAPGLSRSQPPRAASRGRAAPSTGSASGTDGPWAGPGHPPPRSAAASPRRRGRADPAADPAPPPRARRVPRSASGHAHRAAPARSDVGRAARRKVGPGGAP